jgi:hypothetical protein
VFGAQQDRLRGVFAVAFWAYSGTVLLIDLAYVEPEAS